MRASGVTSCAVWDPKLGLTIEQIRNRFPYAIWDSNIYHEDNSPNAKFPFYYLVCDRCVESWNEYAAANTPPVEKNFVISITESRKILISKTEFSIEQISAVAETISDLHSHLQLHIRADKSIDTDIIKAVVKACAEKGLTNVIFEVYSDEAERPATTVERSEAGPTSAAAGSLAF